MPSICKTIAKRSSFAYDRFRRRDGRAGDAPRTCRGSLRERAARRRDASACRMRYLGKRKKRRADRNYILYALTTETGDNSYIGLTVARGRAFLRSVKIRIQKHYSRARQENHNWALCEFLRKNPKISMQAKILKIIRGRKSAYMHERKYITKLKPNLNTF